MKKIIVGLFSLVFMLSTNICMAYSVDDFSVGGVRLGMSYQDVVSMYGEPTLIKGSLDIGEWAYVNYGDTVQITFANGEVWNVFSIGNNGWSLPSGITVGSKAKEALNIYGKGHITTIHKAFHAGCCQWKLEESEFPYNTYCLTINTHGDFNNLKDDDLVTSVQIGKNSPVHDKFE